MSAISVIVITRNEERNIVECLESVHWAREIVVVDGESEDKTVELARRFTKKVFVKKWQGFGASKNFALQQCTSDWVLWLDADERLTKDLSAEIESLISKKVTPFIAYEVPRKSYFLGKWIKHCGWYPGYVTRLFKRGSGHFSDNRVHERLEIDGQVDRLRGDLLHYTDPNLWHYFEKLNRYTALAAEELSGRQMRFRVGQLIFRPMWVFVRMYFVKLGFLDGIQGFILCVLSACYVFTKYAKLWELSSSTRKE